jgi:hypothetical protein
MGSENGKLHLVRIEDLQEADAFKASGSAFLKVVKGGKTYAIEVGITSIPQDIIEDFAKRAPKAPKTTLMIDPQSEEGRRLGVTGQGKQRVQVPDYTDARYIEQRDAHDLAYRQAIVGLGVTSTLRLKSGKIAETPQERYQALDENGLSGLHFAELAQSILKLTDWSEEERENFTTLSTASKES